MQIRFQGVLEKYENNLYNFHIKVPSHIVTELADQGVKRFLCSLKKGEQFHASLIPAGEGAYFIKVNKELRTKNSISIGDEFIVEINEDASQYGMPLPDEMAELFIQDPEGDFYFHQLTPGKQRSLLYLVGKIKSPDKRIEKSVIILEHLRAQKGDLDFKILHQDFKEKKGLL